MDLEAEAKNIVEAAKRQGVSEFLEETEIPNLHAGVESLKRVASNLRRKTPQEVAHALGVLQGAARHNAALLAALERDRANTDAAQAIAALAESHAIHARQAALAEAESAFKSRLHEARQKIREELARKGWIKPSTVKEARTRCILNFLQTHSYITAKQVKNQFGLRDINSAQDALSRMRREGYVERIRLHHSTGRTTSAYALTEIGRQYNPRSELPKTGKINGRHQLLTYLAGHEGATKNEIDALTTSASILFNSVRDGLAEPMNGGYYVSEKGMEKLQRKREHPADSRQILIRYLETHGSISNAKTREITGLTPDGARLLLETMRAEEVIQDAGALGSVLVDNYKPAIELTGGTRTEQFLRYAASSGGNVPVRQVINIFPGISTAQRAELIQNITHAYDGGVSYCERRNGNLVMTGRGYERIGLTAPVTVS